MPFALLALALACRATPLPEGARYPAGTAFSARFVTVAGTRIRYIDAGTGAPVVLLHGLGAALYTWRRCADLTVDVYRQVAVAVRPGTAG